MNPEMEKQENAPAEGDTEQTPELNEKGYTEEEWNAPIFAGGPTRREVEEWKEKYRGVYFTPFDDEVYVWRVLERNEYRELINDRELTTLDRQEKIVEKCVLFPRNYTREKMITGKAGVPSLLSEMIMEKSGFVASSAPIKL
jgi:hypothetical protein